MYEDSQDINIYLSLKNESGEEQKYLSGLYVQYITATESGSYHLALFAYHLLFMSFVYQTIFKIKIWLPERFNDALIQSPKDKRDLHREAKTVWGLSDFPESSIFELLNLLKDCNGCVKKCKNLVKHRNNSFGHATGILVSEETFNQKIQEYNQIANEIQQMTHEKLDVLFQEFIELFEEDNAITKDDLELNLIINNRLSEKDLECLATECGMQNTIIHNKIKDVLIKDYGIEISVI